METFSALLAICAGNSRVPGEFPAQRPVTRSFDVFFDLRLKTRLSKQSWGWWFETLSCLSWRHCNAISAGLTISTASKPPVHPSPVDSPQKVNNAKSFSMSWLHRPSHLCSFWLRIVYVTPFAVLPLVATRFAVCTGGIWVTFMEPYEVRDLFPWEMFTKMVISCLLNVEKIWESAQINLSSTLNFYRRYVFDATISTEKSTSEIVADLAQNDM